MLRAADNDSDLSCCRMRFVMHQQLGGRSAPKLFKLLRQLSRDAKLPIRHDHRAGREGFQDPVRRFEKHGRFLARGGSAQLALALATLHRQGSAEKEMIRWSPRTPRAPL